MCGIGGFMKFGKTPIDPDAIQLLLTLLEKRGAQATGIALGQEDGRVDVFKMPEPAWKTLISDELDKFMGANFKDSTKIVLLHTRAATTSSAMENANNHPMYKGKAAAIHNGTIRNDGELFGKFKLERSCSTDSDIVRAIVDRDGLTSKAIHTLNDMVGGAAIAVIHPEYPGKLLLARSGNPITLGYDEKTDIMAFASLKEYLYHATKPVLRRANMFFQGTRSDMAFYAMPDNTAYIFGPEGKEYHAEFKTAEYFQPVDYRVNDVYHEQRMEMLRRQGRTDQKLLAAGENADVYECPGCHRAVHLDKEQKVMKLRDLSCKACGTYLEE